MRHGMFALGIGYRTDERRPRTTAAVARSPTRRRSASSIAAAGRTASQRWTARCSSGAERRQDHAWYLAGGASSAPRRRSASAATAASSPYGYAVEDGASSRRSPRASRKTNYRSSACAPVAAQPQCRDGKHLGPFAQLHHHARTPGGRLAHQRLVVPPRVWSRSASSTATTRRRRCSCSRACLAVSRAPILAATLVKAERCLRVSAEADARPAEAVMRQVVRELGSAFSDASASCPRPKSSSPMSTTARWSAAKPPGCRLSRYNRACVSRRAHRAPVRRAGDPSGRRHRPERRAVAAVGGDRRRADAHEAGAGDRPRKSAGRR